MKNFTFLKSPSEVNMDIAKRMRERRKEKKLSQTVLSERSDVSLGSLKRFEQTGEISLSSLVKIAFALGCEGDFDRLFARKGYASIQEVIDAQD
ncbi:MAG: helix-turn-helix transcriptional regulator [Lachnospiraceae bacterium]|nr:helix-turn-helix transcriptional regulator [Lachnospiraceae bacterium]